MTRQQAAKRARPAAQKAGYTKVYARITESLKAELVNASKRTGLSLSELVRRNLEARAGRLGEVEDDPGEDRPLYGWYSESAAMMSGRATIYRNQEGERVYVTYATHVKGNPYKRQNDPENPCQYDSFFVGELHEFLGVVGIKADETKRKRAIEVLEHNDRYRDDPKGEKK